MSNPKAIQLQKPIEELIKQTFVDLFDQKGMAKMHQEMGFIMRILNRRDAKGRPSKLLDCTPESIANCIKSAANLDLSFDPALDHLSMMPFKSNAALDVSYKGQVFFLAREGVIIRAVGDTVCANDPVFKNRGLTMYPVHEREGFKERGKVLTAYCYFELPGGGWHGKVLSQEEIEMRKKMDRRKNNDSQGFFWSLHEKKMLMKTASREARWGLPYGPQVARLTELDNQHFDPSQLDVTDARLKEIEEEIKGIEEVPALYSKHSKLPPFERNHVKVTKLFEKRKEEIGNTIQVPTND